MVRADFQFTDYLTKLTCGDQYIFSDVGLDKGGQGNGCRPHDLLEAAFASCLQITMRMYAREHDIEVGESSVRVELMRSDQATRFEYDICFDDCCADDVRERIRDVLSRCPVKTTLSRQITFQLKSSD
jgi:putative redox protein